MRLSKRMNRRDFLSSATWVLGGLIGAAMGIPAIAYIIGPALKKDERQNWFQLGSAAKVELGTPTLFKVRIER